MRVACWIVTGLSATIVVGIALSSRTEKEPDNRILPADHVDESITYSNILPADYVGPETCAECHKEQYDLWSQHPHHFMNQMADEQAVMGDFDDSQLVLPTGTVLFTTSDGKHWMTIEKRGEIYRRYVVTRTVGSRYMQFYIGRQTAGPEAEGHDIYHDHMLPFSYWFKIRRWFPRQYFDPDGPEILCNGIPQVEAVDRMPDVRTYEKVCMNCHNTFAYSFRLYHKKYVGFPNATIAAAIEPLSQELSDTIALDPTVESFTGANARLDPNTDLVSLGISCESCHFGGREHALNKQQVRFLPTSKFTHITPKHPDRGHTSDRQNATTINGICTQCHSGNGKLFPNGAGKANSREALDFHAGFCHSQLRCADCHEPHTATSVPSGGPDNPLHVQVCTTCHEEYDDPKAALLHSGHSSSADVNCLDCHMPRYTQGLDELIRTHRITMPVEEKMVAQGMANACNLCHIDKSQRWTLTQLERTWGKRIHLDENWASYDKLDKPAGEAWLHGDDIHMRLVAAQCYEKSPFGEQKLPDLIRALNDPEPINRVFATFAVKRLLNRPLDEALEVDITATPATRKRQIEAMLDNFNLE